MAEFTGWEAEQRIGEVALSEQTTLLVSIVRHAGRWHLRMRTHRQVAVDGKPQTIAGKQGMVLPIAALPDLRQLLEQAEGEVPKQWPPVGDAP